MIRLSCWIGVMRSKCGETSLVQGTDPRNVPTDGISRVRCFVSEDPRGSGGMTQEPFANAAPRLACHFVLTDADNDCEAGLDERVAAWRHALEGFVAHIGDVPSRLSPPHRHDSSGGRDHG
jgi:hypothetical protein